MSRAQFVPSMLIASLLDCFYLSRRFLPCLGTCFFGKHLPKQIHTQYTKPLTKVEIKDHTWHLLSFRLYQTMGQMFRGMSPMEVYGSITLEVRSRYPKSLRVRGNAYLIRQAPDRNAT